MKSKHKKSVPKTRGHKVEKRPYVPIRKHAGSQQPSERETTDPQEHRKDTERKGDQDSHPDERGENKEEHPQVVEGGATENSEKSVHPGPIQAVSELYKWCADDTETTETGIEAEELQ